jgi:hypothetical protein
MPRAPRSGIVVTDEDVPLILAMVARGDRRHDFGALFGLNQGRVREVERGDYGLAPPAPANQLPPSGSPGPKAKGLRRAVARVERSLAAGNPDIPQALDELRRAIAAFDRME